MSQTPMQVKREILADMERFAALPISIEASAPRAALNVIFAYGAHFTDQERNTQNLCFQLTKGVDEGSLIAANMEDLIRKTLCEDSPAAVTPESYTLALRASIKALAKSDYAPLRGLGIKPTFSGLLEAVWRSDSMILIAHYAVIYQVLNELPAKHVNAQNPATGETALALACRLGDHTATRKLLSLGADTSICTFDGCSPLHWLFMFDDEHYLSINLRSLNYHDALNKVCGRPLVLDAQLPADLQGSHLSFAIASASKAAVMAIIANSHQLQHSIIRQAWCLASSLHLHTLMEKLPKFYEQDPSFFHFGLGDIARSSPLLTKLIHGSNLEAAQRASLRELYVRRHSFAGSHVSPLSQARISNQWPFPESRHPTTEATILTHALTDPILFGLESAIQVGEMNIASEIILQVMGDASELKPEVFYLGAYLSHICARVACGSSRGVPNSIKILEFLLDHCTRLGFLYGWFLAVVTTIQRHRQDLFHWLTNRPHTTGELNFRTPAGDTVLHVALSYMFTKVCPIDHLLSLGADPTILNARGFTPLDLAAQLGVVKEIECLLEFGNAIPRFGTASQTPLHSAIAWKSVPLLSKLLENPTQQSMIDCKDQDGRSPLILAVNEGFVEGVKILLMSNASISVSDKLQDSPLYFAAVGKLPSHLEILQILLRQPIGLRATDHEGNTLLHVTIRSQARLSKPNWKMLRDLAVAGAGVDIVNKHGDLPLTLAMIAFNTSLFSLLLPYLLGLESRGNSLTQDPRSLALRCQGHEINAALAVEEIQAHQDSQASYTHQRFLMRCLQAIFNHATNARMDTIIRHFLIYRIPVFKSVLCQPSHASILASAIFTLDDNLLDCYTEVQMTSTLLSIDDQIPQYSLGSEYLPDYDPDVYKIRNSLWDVMTPRALTEVDRLLMHHATRYLIPDDSDGDVEARQPEKHRSNRITNDIKESSSTASLGDFKENPLCLWQHYQDLKSLSTTEESSMNPIIAYPWKIRQICLSKHKTRAKTLNKSEETDDPA